ncbi:MAG: adenosylmethionine decarboxylase [Acidobacteriota bacterium]
MAQPINSRITNTEPLARQLLVEFFGCKAPLLGQAEALEQALVEAAVSADAKVVNSLFHKFAPHGISGIVLIAESHLSIHTWPEYRYAALDVFTCSNTVDPYRIKSALAQSLKAGKTECRLVRRGDRLRPGPDDR